MVGLNRYEQLELKAAIIRDRAVKKYNEAMDRANELDKMAKLLRENRNDLKQSKVTEFETLAKDVENEWLTERLEERKAMKARGEDIVVPDTIEELKILLSQ